MSGCQSLEELKRLLQKSEHELEESKIKLKNEVEYANWKNNNNKHIESIQIRTKNLRNLIDDIEKLVT